MTIKVTYNVTDVYMSQSVSPVYINVSYSDGGASGGGVWGSITGTLSNQTDLQTALDLKLDESTIDGGTEGQILSKSSGTDFDFAWINNYAKYLATNVRNQTGSTIGAFQVVYISGATGNKPLISLADADTEATSSKTYGVTATAIANNGTGDVVTAGELSGINTSAFNEGDLLWLSTTAGGVVTTPPAEPAHAVFIGYVVRSHPTLGVIDVAIANGYELNELHGVQITSAANNDGLFYNSSNGLWENKSIATVLGYTPEQPLTFNSPLSRAGNVVSIPQATGSVNGFLSATDWTTFNSKQAALGFTPANAATTLTINGVTFDLSTSRTWTIAAGISGSGASGQVTYWTGASAVSGSNNLFWDNTNGRLGIGTNAPQNSLDVIRGTAGTMSRNAYETASFSFNNDIKVGIYTSSSNSAHGAGLIFGQTNLQASSAYPSFEMQYVYSSTVADNNWRINYTGRAANGIVSTYAANLFNVYADGRIIINPATLGVTASAKLLLGAATDNGQRLQVYGDTLLRGSGATSATTALTVQNSSSTNLFTVRNDGNTNISNGLQVQGPLNGALSGAGFELEYNSGISYVTSYSRIGSAWLPMILRSSDLTITTAGTNKAQFFSASGNLILQNGGTFTDVASSRLTVNSTTQGFLPPRMTTTQKNAISSPAAGLVVYDTTLNKLCVYTTAWETITSI